MQVVILSAPCTGSSMLAGILGDLGIYMGKGFLKPDARHPTGSCEDLAFWQLNNEILRAASGYYLRPPSRRKVRQVWPRYRARAKGLVKKRDKRHTVWGWKNPRTAFVIECYATLLDDPCYLWLTRDEAAVARSLLRSKDILTEKQARKLAAKYNGRIERFVEGKRHMTFQYERILEFPLREILRLIRGLGLERKPIQLRAAIARVRPELNHHPIKCKEK